MPRVFNISLLIASDYGEIFRPTRLLRGVRALLPCPCTWLFHTLRVVFPSVRYCTGATRTQTTFAVNSHCMEKRVCTGATREVDKLIYEVFLFFSYLARANAIYGIPI